MRHHSRPGDACSSLDWWYPFTPHAFANTILSLWKLLVTNPLDPRDLSLTSSLSTRKFLISFQQQFKHHLPPLGSLFNSALVCFGPKFCTSPDSPGLTYFAGLGHLLRGDPSSTIATTPNVPSFSAFPRWGLALAWLHHTHRDGTAKTLVPEPDPLRPLSFSYPSHFRAKWSTLQWGLRSDAPALGWGHIIQKCKAGDSFYSMNFNQWETGLFLSLPPCALNPFRLF